VTAAQTDATTESERLIIRPFRYDDDDDADYVALVALSSLLAPHDPITLKERRREDEQARAHGVLHRLVAEIAYVKELAVSD
jgi:hypothetical protein